MAARDDARRRRRVVRARHAVAFLAIAVLGAACGAAVEPESDPGGASTQGDAETVSPEEDSGVDRPGRDVLASSGTFFAFSAAEPGETRPIDELYSVFVRPRNDADRRAGTLAARWGALDMGDDLDDVTDRPPGVSAEQWEAMRPGEVLEAEGRLLLEGLGGQEDKLYAAPTTNGHICHALLPNGGGSCGAPGPDGLDLSWSLSPSGGLVVYGLVGDEIASVDVVVAGETRVARMGENGFGVRFEGTKARLDRIVLHRRDGSENVIHLGFADGG